MAAKLIKNKGTNDGFCCPNARFQLKKGASFLPFAASRIHLSVAARIHPSRKYIFPLSRGCIHQENVFFPLPQGCIHQENVFFRCRRGACIKKIYFSVVAGVHTSRKYIFSLSQRCIHQENIFFGSKISFATDADGTFSWHHSLLKRHFFAPRAK